MKKLISNTIIPDTMYVKRTADSDLEKTIHNMGRPASILVSRQMGKTNLLLNAKRNIEGNNIKFIYIDLSSTLFNEIRDCFRYIIDTAIDINLDTFENIENIILENRLKNRLANREHEQELLILLKQLNGKLIIVLDEIDSMVKYNFSDQFFSQIRSVYFASRTNYPEFHNLTYILSGVLEPSEIIQDKTKSPFNISDKIYLNDFTIDEYKTFIKNIDLSFFTDEITNEIYEWTSGHPRITWDICSKLEDLYYEKNTISIDDVNSIVTKLYLTHSDTPPIDNIKQIISEDIPLAQIILDIKQNIYLNISDAIKNKLYLFGVIEIENSDKVVLKNKIIEENLSEEFLKNIIYSEASAFEIAQQYFNKDSYSEAIVEYSRFLVQNNISDIEKNIALINAGLCLYYLGNYTQALEHMNKVTIDKERDSYNYYVNETNKGLVLLNLTQYDKSLKVFNQLLEHKDIKSKIKAKMYIAQNYYYIDKDKEKLNFLKNIDETISLLQEELIRKDLSEDDKKVFNTLLINSYYIKANYYINLPMLDKATLFFNYMLDMDIDAYKPSIYLHLAELDKSNRENYSDVIFDTIKKSKLNIDYFDELKFSVLDIYEYIDLLIDLEKEVLLKEFLNYCSNSFNDLYPSKCAVLMSAGLHFSNKNKFDKSLKIFNYSFQFEDKEIAFKTCYKDIYVQLVNYSFIYDYESLSENYFQYLNKVIDFELQNELTKDDFFFLSQSIGKMIQHKDVNNAKKALLKIDNHILKEMPDKLEPYKITFYDLKYKLSENKDDKFKIANECLTIINENKYSIKELPDDFRQYAKNIEKSHNKFIKVISSTTTRNTKKFPRNAPCSCGSNKKYKQCCG